MATQGTRHPTSSVSTAHCQHQALHRGSSWREPAGIFVLLEPTQEPARSSWGKSHLSPNADLVPAPPRVGSGSWCREKLAGRGVSPGFEPCLPASPASLMEKACRIIVERKFIRIFTFSSVLRPLEAKSNSKERQLRWMRILLGSLD